MLSTTTVRTFNSLGHRAWAKTTNKNLKLDSKKSANILRAIIDEIPKKSQGPLWDSYWNVIHAVGMAKALGYIPEGIYPDANHLCPQGDFHASLEELPDDLTSDLIDATLTRSIKQAYEGLIDYNDQVYMPALFGTTLPRFPLVKVDEYQDLNPTNHALLDKLVRHRLIGVGDPWQNIYGFRGAKQGGMQEAEAKFKMTACSLSQSFRCPSEIVRNVHWRVPHFTYTRTGGYVENLKRIQGTDFAEDSAILCRNNAPLFRLALHLLSAGRSVQVAGSDIGPKLLGIMRRLGDTETSAASLLGAIDDWEAEKLAKQSTTAHDLAACMRVFASFGATLGQAISYAEHLFAQRGTIRLLTGHKAKGLEWQTVYILDQGLIGHSEQELNLRYVMETRSQDRLFYINSQDIQW